MTIGKEELRKALYAEFGLGDTADPALRAAVGRAFSGNETGRPDPEEVLARAARPAPKRPQTLLRYWPVAAALLLAPVLYLLLTPRMIPAPPALQLLSWKGTPQLKSGTPATTLKTGATLAGTIRITTGPEEHCTLGTGASRLTIGEKSSFTVAPLAREGDKPVLTARLAAGIASFDIAEKSFARFRVAFPGGELSVTGTRFAVQVENGTTRIALLSGTLAATAGTTPLTLAAGSGCLIREGQGQLIPDIAKNEAFRTVFTAAGGKPAGPAQPAPFSERLFMKDGSVLTGKILSQDRDNIRIRTAYGLVTVPWSTVQRVAYIK